PAGEAVGRIGCYFNGCCYGSASHVPWAVYQHGEYRHPAQIYSSIAAALLLAIVFAASRLRLYPGALFHLYLSLWGGSRCSLEFFRERQPMLFGLDLMQLAAVETFLFGGAALVVLTTRRKSIDPTT